MEEYKLWLKKTREDLRWTKHNLEVKEYSGTCFSAQQAVEKSLKAYLLFKGKSLRKTHDVIALLKDCIEVDDSFEELEDMIEVLFPYYATTRYPFGDELFTFSKMRAKKAYSAASKIVKFVEEKI
ncbi:hypothetical protein A3A48_02255 [Candidatus Curtissbacteria bacterium RIFCSPLOWO2_01_FULL_37_9]|uniref:HEPN domain-containing protein n=1 Tax=Candidatus Curtissbacteria bacterium RIFCSPLOWO2_01_FULL_37_9 TaxID=1797724 RepID=A0A1F5GQ21_9BACT|nr:MAG: hypothetical protein A3A48_02255 [Candidatus Curtissbacteria bacterium RIFCSPLOWO2_01_FULL_37_9]